MPFIPHTPHETRAMLDAMGVNTLEELFDEIPPALLAKKLGFPGAALTEMEITQCLTERMKHSTPLLNFLGAGAYEHYIPAAVWDITSRGEFLTAYTPYQAEASQGTLQLLYEYQSMMTALTEMDVSNASLYDGASALAEAILMSVRLQKKNSILLPLTVSPFYRDTVHTLVKQQGITLLDLPFDKTGTIDKHALASIHTDDCAALVIPQPNFFGCLEDVNALTDWAQSKGILSIAQVNPLSLGLLSPPGNWGKHGADLACGEGQPLGIPVSSGGPYFGFLCCKKAYVRQMPGRIVGRTQDAEEKEGFVLTLQAREQHIRRAKATSNICTNQGLLVTAATIYMSLMGPSGLKYVASTCHHRTQQLLTKLTQIPGVEHVFSSPYFHEIVIRVPNSSALLKALSEKGIQAGLPLAPYYPNLENCLLLCATETKTEKDIADLHAAFLTVEAIALTQNHSGKNQ
ncbi:MAG: aminomethyl-transferring glycine dehydrogenase subunit GcvPA [Gammaproteobacteria bacterium]|nr:aminomethyl-transferring glycine dehydrogenase subunit GcvPA [Gammaproteobacteria bacterium]